MKLARIKTENGIVPAVLDADGAWRDLSAHVADITAEVMSPDGLTKLADVALDALPVVTGTPAPFLKDFGRVFCIGLNYSDHAEELGMAKPENPILFMKACDVTGANDPIILPKGAEKGDWELELGVVIGSHARHVSESEALSHVAGYCVANDVSERHFQFDLGGQWVKGKSADSFAPVGPYLVTADEVADPQNLSMWLDVNGERMQTGNTEKMIFSVAQIIAHVSQFITLRPGDLFMTGTPPGVGSGHKPPRFLKAGDVVTASIAGMGEMRQEVVAYRA